jgi:hypothetical protein
MNTMSNYHLSAMKEVCDDFEQLPLAERKMRLLEFQNRMEDRRPADCVGKDEFQLEQVLIELASQNSVK